MVGHLVNGVGFVIPVSVPSKMRGDLNVSAVTTDAVQVFNDNGVWTNVSIQGVTHVGGGVYHLKFDTPDDAALGNTYLVIGIIALSADL
jgi:hypothetical protein